MHVPYTHPAPMPATTAPRYSTGSDCAAASMSQAAPTITPPNTTTSRGPKRSTSQPSTGTSHVSVRTNIVNATWIEARVQ